MLLFTMTCKLEFESDTDLFQKGHDWVERMERMIQMRPANVKLKDTVAQCRATRRIFTRAEFGNSLTTRTRPPATETLRAKPEPPAQHLMRSNGLNLSEIPDGEASLVDPMRCVGHCQMIFACHIASQLMGTVSARFKMKVHLCLCSASSTYKPLELRAPLR
jgi:hypothetical protein